MHIYPNVAGAPAAAAPSSRRTVLPKFTDRLSLGHSGLSVSPFCIGIVDKPETVSAAYEAGINFFFITADLHWPLYEGVRRGVADLLASGKARRDDIVVGVVSYLGQPLFQALQFHEVLDCVPGMERVDLMVAGAVSNEQDFGPRVEALVQARQMNHSGARALGASFHHRPFAALATHSNLLDIVYTRYNASHPGARRDLYPYLPPNRATLNFNFKSAMAWVPEERFKQLGLGGTHWHPQVTDHYRFVLTRPEVDGLLCSPSTPEEVSSLAEALDKGPLRDDEEEYIIWLSAVASPKYFV
jgi:hypothetical protein